MNEGSIDWRWAQGCRCLGHTLHHAQDGRPLWGGTGWWVGGEDRPGGREGREFLPPPPQVLNPTSSCIYFFFLNPASLPEASNLLFNIGLCD